MAKSAKKSPLPRNARPVRMGNTPFDCYAKRVGTKGGGKTMRGFCRVHKNKVTSMRGTFRT